MTYVAAEITSPKGHFLTLEAQVSRCADEGEGRMKAHETGTGRPKGGKCSVMYAE